MRMRMFEALATAAFACLPIVPARAQPAGSGSPPAIVYTARLLPMNTAVTGREASGEARFTVAGDTLTVSITARGVAPGITHWQHFHGFRDNRDASCPAPAADVNHDGIIDLIETEPAVGTTMVPFQDNPASMQVMRDTYPKAAADGTYEYRKTVSLKALTAAFAKAFGGQPLDLDRRVVIIHGVPPATRLPMSAASLGAVPAQVTVPVACGKIERALP